ncbi:MAG: hypothetical protein IKJ62_01245 [Alphaproteobacteria bacterium]|nr:hypothetical protein [Alphaproteobacteria bacterium]
MKTNKKEIFQNTILGICEVALFAALFAGVIISIKKGAEKQKLVQVNKTETLQHAIQKTR